MRASEAPEYWQEVLNALNAYDYELAHKLAVKYRFVPRPKGEKELETVRHTPMKGDYVAMDPKGKIYCHEKANVLSGYFGLSSTYVISAIKRLGEDGGYSKSGRMRGWRFWRE